MEKTERYRHELKYRISLADYYAIRQRLRPVMKPDEQKPLKDPLGELHLGYLIREQSDLNQLAQIYLDFLREDVRPLADSSVI